MITKRIMHSRRIDSGNREASLKQERSPASGCGSDIEPLAECREINPEFLLRFHQLEFRPGDLSVLPPEPDRSAVPVG
ncbi:hypothetical protein D3C71_1921570 [compost metagenome]